MENNSGGGGGGLVAFVYRVMQWTFL